MIDPDEIDGRSGLTPRERARLCAQAWHLIEEGRTVRGVAKIMGLPVSTAHTYIEEGRKASPWVQVLARQEARARKAVRLHLYREWLIEERDELLATGDEDAKTAAKDYVGVILQVEDRLAKVEGTDAPREIALSDLRDLPTPNPLIVEEIAAVEWEARNEEDRIKGTG